MPLTAVLLERFVGISQLHFHFYFKSILTYLVKTKALQTSNNWYCSMMADEEEEITISPSTRGGNILHCGGRSYIIKEGKRTAPAEEGLDEDEIADLSPAIVLGQPGKTALNLYCRDSECGGTAFANRYDDGSFHDFEIKRGMAF